MQDSAELETVRQDLDKVDGQILDLISRRKQLVKEVTRIKLELGLDAHQPGRYAQMLAALQEQGQKLGLDPELVAGVWDAIHIDSMKQQNKDLK